MKKILSIALLIAVVATMALAASAGSLGQKYPKGDVALVDAGSITIDGIKDAAYADGAVIVADTYRDFGVKGENGAVHTNYLLWDGTYLYIFTEVKDNSAYEPSLVKLLTESHNTDCVEYFIVWDNSDCPDVETYESDSSMDLWQYRASYEPTNGGWFTSKPQSGEVSGFANGAEDTVGFSTESGAICNGKVVTTPSGYSIEVQIVMPKTNRAGLGNYAYGEGYKIAIITQQFDTNAAENGWPLSLTIPEVGTPSGEIMINKSTAWDCAYYDFVELKGNAAPADTTAAPDTTEAPADTTAAPDTTEAPADTQTQAPDTTKAPAPQNPQTSDMAVAGVAILATLALAGVVVAKKVR